MPQKADNSHLGRLVKRDLAHPPPWLLSNLMFEGITGSEAYGCRDTQSGDYDIVGFAIPPKHVVFPHLAGHIHGYGDQPETFDQYEQQHIVHKESRREYDVVIYGITKFFSLTADGNPNMIDNLFLPRRCVTKSTAVYEHVREHRRLFLSTKCFHTFKGYAGAQLSKIQRKRASENPKRRASIEKFGYDVKYGYHLVRLMLECEQILTTGNLVLDRDSKIYVDIRNGEWSEERLFKWFEERERQMEDLKNSAVVPHAVDHDAIKRVLLECLEMHYGSIANAISMPDAGERLLADLKALVHKHEGQFESPPGSGGPSYDGLVHDSQDQERAALERGDVPVD